MLKTLTFILNIFNTNTLDLPQNCCNFASQLRNNGEPNQHQMIVNPQLSHVMETKNSAILPLYGNSKIDGYTHVKISLGYDKGGMNYFSGNINLIITDHVNDDDVDYMRGVWDDNIERLHRVSGL